MMKRRIWRGPEARAAAGRLLLAALLITPAGCGSGAVPTDPSPPPPPPASVLLKEIVIARLPSPYYHFDYDADARVTGASFASGFTMYHVRYAGGRISEMQNDILVNKDRLVYAYDAAGRVGEVDYIDETGLTFTRVHFAYDGSRLIALERERRRGAGFVVEKTMSMSYDTDGNLQELVDHRPAIAGVQDESRVVDRFEDYDTGINVDGFSLLHNDFFDHLVLLPAVQLQNGNPRRETLTGDGLNYGVEYTYTYDDRHRPLTKTGDLTILNGPDAGRRVRTSSVFSYY